MVIGQRDPIDLTDLRHLIRAVKYVTIVSSQVILLEIVFRTIISNPARALTRPFQEPVIIAVEQVTSLVTAILRKI